MILSASYNQASIQQIKNSFVVNKVKEIVHRYDEDAEIILFGSRARGDWHEESDWDFLVLSKLDERNDARDKIRIDILHEIEYATSNLIFTLFHNKEVWEEDYAVTDIYDSIQEDGIIL
jgi:predicted nucleotidyltransferase